MKIGIIGCGVIGEATAQVLERRGYLPSRHDPAKGWRDGGPFDIAFICVPTPAVDGRLETAYVEDALEQTRAGIKVVRSTVPLGFMQDGVYMPSFMRERFPHEEAHPRFRMFAGDTNELVAGLFGSDVPSFHVDYRTAEFTKLALNANLAMQVSFATEMADAARQVGASWGYVVMALRHDPRIGEYLMPGPFDGKCLPKDTANLATQTDSTLLRAVLEVNDAYSYAEIAKEEQYAISQ